MKNNKLMRLLNKLEAFDSESQSDIIIISINESMAKNLIALGGNKAPNVSCTNNGSCSGNLVCGNNEVCNNNPKCFQ